MAYRPAIQHMTMRAAADYWGVSERTLRRWVAEGRLRAYRVGPRAVRVRAEDVEALCRPIPTVADC